MDHNNTDHNKPNNVIAFPGPRVDFKTTYPIPNDIKEVDKFEGLTELERLELQRNDYNFSSEPDKDRDLAYELAFKGNSDIDIKNLYHRPRFAQDFEMAIELQDAFNKLEIQFNQWDYLNRKIAYYKRS